MKKQVKEDRVFTARFRKVLASGAHLDDDLPVWVFMTDIRLKDKGWKQQFVYINEKALAELGYTQADAESDGLCFFRNAIHPEDLNKLWEIITDSDRDADVHHSLIRFRRRYRQHDIYVLVHTQKYLNDAAGTKFILRHCGILVMDVYDRTMNLHSLMRQFEMMMRPKYDFRFTNREMEILLLIARGESISDICEKIHRSEATVKTHIKHILQKLGKKKISAAIYELSKMGLI
jgi:DNA-binding CsgD family transcriptional regulator